jgi:hypothetical protein
LVASPPRVIKSVQKDFYLKTFGVIHEGLTESGMVIQRRAFMIKGNHSKIDLAQIKSFQIREYSKNLFVEEGCNIMYAE